MQKYAEESIKEHLTDLQKRFDAEQRGRKTDLSITLMISRSMM
jgi:hypothetical protein